MSADTPDPIRVDDTPPTVRLPRSTPAAAAARLRRRMAPLDPREEVTPAHPDPNHMAIVITTVAVMLVTALVTVVLSLTGEISWPVARTLGSVILAALGILWVSDRWFRRFR